MASLLTVPGDSDVPPGMRRGRSASLAWVDFLSTDSPFPSDDDERRGSVSVPIYDHTKQRFVFVAFYFTCCMTCILLLNYSFNPVKINRFELTTKYSTALRMTMERSLLESFWL